MEGEVMKGWYLPVEPDEAIGDSTAWYTSFGGFWGNFLGGGVGTVVASLPRRDAASRGGLAARRLLVGCTPKTS